VVKRAPAVLAAALLAAGCAAAVDPAGGGAAPAAGGAAADPAQAAAQVQPGLGTLRQEEVTVSLRSGALLIKVVPLDESVTRLLAPDTYQRTRALAESRRADAERAASEPALFLVSFFSYEPDVVFQSEALQLSHRGRLLRPALVLPVSSGFGAQRLQQQETQQAVYVFDSRIDYDQPITVRYGLEQSDAWSAIIPRLEVERGRVRARAGG
jgi:hypothetical protein